MMGTSQPVQQHELAQKAKLPGQKCSRDIISEHTLRAGMVLGHFGISGSLAPFLRSAWKVRRSPRIATVPTEVGQLWALHNPPLIS